MEKNFSASDDKINNAKTKATPRKVYASLKDCDVITNLKELEKIFVSVPIDKGANNVAIIYTISLLLICINNSERIQ